MTDGPAPIGTENGRPASGPSRQAIAAAPARVSIPGLLLPETRIVRAAELVPTPWRNGRGLTRDVARSDRADGALDWLLSVADLTEDAPFSHFARIDRAFTLLEGGPVDFGPSGERAATCLPFLPCPFPGDTPTRCVLGGRAARAFNVFADRSRFRLEVKAARLAGTRPVALGPATALHLASGRATIGSDALGTGDTLLGAAVGQAVATGGQAAAAGGAAIVLVVRLVSRAAAEERLGDGSQATA